jgi:UDP-glucose 4-epimerase
MDHRQRSYGEQMKRYLVNGGAGFIGSHLCDRLIESGSDVVILDNFTSGKMENLSVSQRLARSGQLTIIDGDIRKIKSFGDGFSKFSAVIHLAAVISGYDSLSSPDDYVDVNVSGLLRTIEFVVQREVPRIIFASSSTVYGDNASSALSEAAVVSPMTVYAVTKLTGEYLLSLYSKMHNFSYCCLRLFNVYGPRQATNHPYANVTCKFAYAASQGLQVSRFGDGEQARDFVFIDDVITAFLAVLERAGHNIYNVGTGESHTINELVLELEKITGRSLDVQQCDPWPNDIRNIKADITRLSEEFQFRPSNNLTTGLRRTVMFFDDQNG